MKKSFRPFCAGYIVLYVLSVLCIGDAVVTLVNQIRGTTNQFLQGFSIFSYLIAALAVVYVKLYASTRVVIDDRDMHIVYPVYIRPEAGQKRAMFIYRSGDTDAHKVDKHIDLNELEKYGYIEDLGYPRLDKSQATEKNKLFPVREVAFVLKDKRRYHLNIAIYSAKQRAEIIKAVRDASRMEPEGSLKELLV